MAAAQMLDAAFAPPRFLAGQRWAGYLTSPHAYHPWSTSQLAAALGGGLLPVYVAPTSAAAYGRHNGATDGLDALAQVKRLNPDRIVVALDTEAGAYMQAQQAAVAYGVAFHHAVTAHGGVVVHYGSGNWLRAIRPHVGPNQHAWLAWYTHRTDWPLPGWPFELGAWQYSNNVKAQGTTVDVSRIGARFPLCHHPAAKPPAPAPAPTHDLADVTLAAAMRAWLKRKQL